MVVVSLLGTFGVGFVLAEGLDRSDCIYARHQAAGLLDGPDASH